MMKTRTETSVKTECWLYMQNLYVLHFVATWQKSDSIKLFKKCGYKLVNAIPETWFW